MDDRCERSIDRFRTNPRFRVSRVKERTRVIKIVMVVSQLVVIVLLLIWQKPWHALAIAALVAGQMVMMRRFLAGVTQRALWYSGFGVPLFVVGMMVSAFALRSLYGVSA